MRQSLFQHTPDYLNKCRVWYFRQGPIVPSCPNIAKRTDLKVKLCGPITGLHRWFPQNIGIVHRWQYRLNRNWCSACQLMPNPQFRWLVREIRQCRDVCLVSNLVSRCCTIQYPIVLTGMICRNRTLISVRIIVPFFCMASSPLSISHQLILGRSAPGKPVNISRENYMTTDHVTSHWGPEVQGGC